MAALKYILYFSIVLLESVSVFGENTDIKEVKGLYYRIYPASEIEGKYNGLLLDSKTFIVSLPIDLENSHKFVVLSSNSDDGDHLTKPLNDTALNKNIRIIFPQSDYIINDLKEAGIATDKFKRDGIIASCALSLAPYCLSEDKKNIYQVAYMETSVQRIDRNEFDDNFWSMTDSDKTDSEIPTYIVTDIKKYDPYAAYGNQPVWWPYMHVSTAGHSNCVKGLYVRRFHTEDITEVYRNEMEASLSTNKRDTPLPPHDCFIPIGSESEAENMVAEILKTNILPVCENMNYTFPSVYPLSKGKRLKLFRFVGLPEKLGMDFTDVYNLETTIRESVRLSPYHISNDRKYIYKFTYLEAETVDYSYEEKRCFTYMINNPMYDPGKCMRIFSRIIQSYPYVTSDKNSLWAPYKEFEQNRIVIGCGYRL